MVCYEVILILVVFGVIDVGVIFVWSFYNRSCLGKKKEIEFWIKFLLVVIVIKFLIDFYF